MSDSFGSPAWAAAARLARHCGLGTTGAEVDELLRVGAGPWIATRIAALQAPPAAGELDPPTLALVGRSGASASRAQLSEELLAWYLRRLVTTREPLREKVVWGWHEHFATSLRGVREPAMMLAQQQTIRRLAVGPFPELAGAMLIDPAMLVWLNGNRNTKTSPNENLAREFLELFCLGVGSGYTETDIREGARALSGWVVDAGVARLEPRRHDPGVKTVCGVTGRLDAAGFAAAVLSGPRWRRHVARRWWRRLTGPVDPPEPLVDRLAAAYGPAGEVAPMLEALLGAPELAAAAGSHVAGPVEWVVGACRALGVTVDPTRARRLADVLRRLGQVPFAPPSVGGWPSGRAWLSTAAAQTRLEVSRELAEAADPALLADIGARPPGERAGHAAYRLGVPVLTDRTRRLAAATGDPTSVVAVLLASPDHLVH